MEGLKAALETTKQVITLSTGVITLTITFLEKIVQPDGSTGRIFPPTLKIGWICFGLSIVFGMWTLMAITGTMNALDRKTHGLTLSPRHERAVETLNEGSNIRVPSMLMLLSFLAATLLTIVTGFAL